MKIVFVDKNKSLVRKVREAVKELPKYQIKNLEIHKGDIFKYKGVIVSASNPSFSFGGGLDRLIYKKFPKECNEARKTRGSKRIGNVIFTVTVNDQLNATAYRVEKALRFALSQTKKRETVLISGLGTGIGGLKEETFVKLFIKVLTTQQPVKKTRKSKVKPILLWKFLREGMKSHYGNCTWKVGQWQKEIKDLTICGNGYHCSTRIIDAFGYVTGEILSQVEVKGKHDSDINKQVWSNMRVVKAYKWEKKDSVELAIYAAELVIDLYEKEYPNDNRPRKAIEAARTWLKNPTEENRLAARSAADSAYSACSAADSARSARSAAYLARSARSAAYLAYSAYSAADSACSAAYLAACSAAYSAYSAAGKAAYSAAYSAAGKAAYSAAYSAYLAAYSALFDKIEAWMLDRVKQLEEVK